MGVMKHRTTCTMQTALKYGAAGSILVEMIMWVLTE